MPIDIFSTIGVILMQIPSALNDLLQIVDRLKEKHVNPEETARIAKKIDEIRSMFFRFLGEINVLKSWKKAHDCTTYLSIDLREVLALISPVQKGGDLEKFALDYYQKNSLALADQILKLLKTFYKEEGSVPKLKASQDEIYPHTSSLNKYNHNSENWIDYVIDTLKKIEENAQTSPTNYKDLYVQINLLEINLNDVLTNANKAIFDFIGALEKNVDRMSLK